MSDRDRRAAAEAAVCNLLLNVTEHVDYDQLSRTIVAEVLEIAYSPAPATAAIPRCRACGHRWGTNTDCETCTVGWG